MSGELEPYHIATDEEMGIRGHLRAADADRERVISFLNRQYGQGRLDSEAHAVRVDAAMKATTVARLGMITKDLPPVPQPLLQRRRSLTLRSLKSLSVLGVVIGLLMLASSLIFMADYRPDSALIIVQGMVSLFGGILTAMISAWWWADGAKKISQREH